MSFSWELKEEQRPPSKNIPAHPPLNYPRPHTSSFFPKWHKKSPPCHQSQSFPGPPDGIHASPALPLHTYFLWAPAGFTSLSLLYSSLCRHASFSNAHHLSYLSLPTIFLIYHSPHFFLLPFIQVSPQKCVYTVQFLSPRVYVHSFQNGFTSLHFSGHLYQPLLSLDW